jgi:hypothetical protein
MQFVFVGNGAPSFAPTKYGQRYVDTVNRQSYTSVGIASSGDWVSDSAAAGNAIRTVSSNTTIAISDKRILASGSPVLSLPDATTCRGMEYSIKNTGTGNVSVVPVISGQTIDGQASISINDQFEVINFVSDGANFFIF